jgi:polar amino acid transport system substrate-binding protein
MLRQLVRLERGGWLLNVSIIAMAWVLVTPSLSYAGEAMKRIKSAGKIIVGTEAALPPFEFIKDGKIVGYGKDILDHVLKDMGVEVEQLDLPWQGILPGIDAGKFDLVATSVTLTPDRAKKYAFTMPISESTHHLLKRKGNTSIKTSDDLIGKRVGVQLGAAGEKSAKWLAERWKKSGKGTFGELKLYPSNPDAYLGLANGDVDAVIHSLPTLAVLIKKRPGIYEIGAPVRELSYYAWVTRPADADLRDYVSGKIEEMWDSGKMHELQDKWFGFRMKKPAKGYLPDGAK